MPDAIGDLAQAATLDDPVGRHDAVAQVIRAELLAMPSDTNAHRLKAQVKASHLMTMQAFDAIAAEVLAEAREGESDDGGLPDCAVLVEGSARCACIPARGGFRGAVLELNGDTWRPLLHWAPRVVRVLRSADDAGGTLGLYFELDAAGHALVTSADDLQSGKCWQVAQVPGTGSKRVREMLANVILAQAATMEPDPALTRTGWHTGGLGQRFYVFADGRTSDGRHVHLVGADEAVRAGAAPVTPELGGVAPALRKIAEHGGGPALAALGLGARAFGQSFHKVLGGMVFVGPKNTGKSGPAWHARNLAIVRQGRANAWPPVPSAVATGTTTSAEAAFDFEADMPSLLDDIALNSKSSRADEARANELLERVFRPLANDTAVRPRMTREMLPRPSNHVRSPVIATAQRLPALMDPSLKRRVLIAAVERGDYDVLWYRDAATTGAPASLVIPLRTLGEHLIIPALAAQADPGAYVLARDAAGMALLRPELDVAAPGWQDSAEGLQGVAEIAAAALGGLLQIAAVAPEVDPAELTGPALAFLARCIAAQGEMLADEAGSDSLGEAAAHALTAALLDNRAHICDAAGVPFPAVPWLSCSDQGLEPIPGRQAGGPPEYRGRGVPVYWLTDERAAGVRSEGMYKLLDAAGVEVRGAKGLARELVQAGAALPSAQASSKFTWQKRVGGASRNLIYLRPDVFFPEPAPAVSSATGTTGTAGTAQVSAGNSNDRPVSATGTTGTHQVTVPVRPAEATPLPTAGLAKNGPDLGKVGCTGSLLPGMPSDPAPGAVPWLAEVAAYLADAEAAGLEGKYAPTPERAIKMISHGRDPARAAAIRDAFALALDLPAEALAELLGDARPEVPAAAPPPAAAPAPAPAVPAQRPPATAEGRRPAFLVLTAEGRAFGPDGEVVELAPDALASVRNIGDLAALGLTLGVSVLWVPREVRELLGLPATLPPGLGNAEGYPHQFTEAADPAVWDVWPASPPGLAGWMPVYRMPAILREGLSVAFAEYLAAVTPTALAWGDLAPGDLAEALTLIWRGTTYDGGDGKHGGVHYRRSPTQTMNKLMGAANRRRQTGPLDAAEVPEVYRRGAGGALSRVRPSPVCPPAEVPAGHVVARVDIRSQYASALGAEFGVGDPVHREGHPPGGLAKLPPGVYRVTAPAASVTLHPALWPFLLPSGRRGVTEVSGWLDVSAVRLLDDEGVPLRIAEAHVWPDPAGRRVYASAAKRITDAIGELRRRDDAPARLAAAVLKAMPNRFIGDMAAGYEGADDRGDPWHRPDHYVTVVTTAEARRQRGLLAAARTPGVLLLATIKVDSAYLAAPSLAEIRAITTPGGAALVLDDPGPGRYRIEASAEVTPELAARLARRGPARDRIAALAEATGGDQ